MPQYSVGTWDPAKQRYTPQRGLSVPSCNCTWGELLIALRELRGMGYEAHRIRDAAGDYDNNDAYVLVERTDGMSREEILRSWKR